jgi:hypothetical protein
MIEIKWNVHKFGRVHKHEYLLFLQEAYKLDSFYGNFKYNGVLVKTELTYELSMKRIHY